MRRHASRFGTRLPGWNGIVLAALAGVVVMSTPALARPKAVGGKRIAVLPPTDGTPKDAIITAKIAAALKKEKIQAITGAPVKKAVAAGVPSSDDDWVALARKLRVDGIVEPAISKTGGKRRVEVVVHNGLDGAVAGRETFSAKGPPVKLAAAAAAGVWRKLGSAIRGTEPPKKDTGPTYVPAPVASEASAAPQPEETAKEPLDTLPVPLEEKSEPPKAEHAKPVASRDRTPGGEGDEFEAGGGGASLGKRGEGMAKPSALEIEIGNRVLFRVFSFTPASAGAEYNERFLFVPQGRVAWFPLRYAGIFLAGEFNPRLETGSKPAYPTWAREIVLGAQARYPLSVGALALGAGYFLHELVLGDAADPNSPGRRTLAWPNVVYQGVRIAASGRFRLWSILQVGAEAAYRLVTSPGEGEVRVRSSNYFPNAKVSFAMDGSLFLGVAIASWLEIRGGVDYRRYVFGALAPGSDNANGTNATGAVDQYLGYTLGVAGLYGGK
jgi:hypothetical protein